MSVLEVFRDVSRQHPNASLVLTPDELALAVRSTPLARWIGRFQPGQNQTVSLRFCGAMKEAYGSAIAREACCLSGVTRTLERRAPLSARKVTRAIDDAERILRGIHRKNAAPAGRPVRTNGTDPKTQVPTGQSTRARPRAAHFEATHEAGRLVIGLREFTARAHGTILAAGKSGRHRPSEAQAQRTVTTPIRQGDATARFNRALHKPDPPQAGSIAHNALFADFPRHHPACALEVGRLTPDAKLGLREKLTATRNHGAFGAAAADEFDDATLRFLVTDTIARFLADRSAARDAVKRLGCDPGIEDALLAQVTHDNIPAELVPAMWRACVRVDFGSDLAALANRLSPQDLACKVSQIASVIGAALKASSIDIHDADKNRMYRHALRFLLAPAGPGQATAVHRQLAQEGCRLREVAEAAAWYAKAFAQNGGANSTAPGSKHLSVYPQDSFEKAAEFSTTVTSLYAVTEEAAGAAARIRRTPRPQATFDDQTVTTLRNIGIPFPAPFRVGASNGSVPLANNTLAEIHRAFRQRLGGLGKPGESGLVPECLEYLRDNERSPKKSHGAQYIVNGTPIPQKADAVAQALREFCTDPDGRLNVEMLKQISTVAHHAPIESVYAGCMNPDRPDLAILNGSLRGNSDQHRYYLSKNQSGDTRLEIVERLAPVFSYTPGQPAIIPPIGQRQHDSNHPTNSIRLAADESNLVVSVRLDFDRQTHEPGIAGIRISYYLMPQDRSPSPDDKFLATVERV